MRFVLALWLLAGSGFAGAGTCPDAAPPWLELEIVASEPADVGPMRRIEIHDSGCVEVTYARLDVRAGTYAFAIPGDELAALAGAVADSGVRGFDAVSVRHELEAVRELRASLAPSGGIVYDVVCADTHRIVVREGGSEQVAAWYGLLPTAQRYGEVDSLSRLARFAQRLDDYSRDARVPLAVEVAR